MCIHINAKDCRGITVFYLVEVPDPAGTLMADHAGPDRGPGRAELPEEFAVGRLGNAPEDPVADAGRVLAHLFVDEAKFFLCVVLLEFLFKPEP